MLTRDEISAYAALKISQALREENIGSEVQLIAKIQCIINTALEKQEQNNEINKKTCALAGVEFPMPEQEPLQYGELYWVAMLDRFENIHNFIWQNDPTDSEYLKNNIVHKTKEGSLAQREAILTAIAEAVKNAQEKS